MPTNPVMVGIAHPTKTTKTYERVLKFMYDGCLVPIDRDSNCEPELSVQGEVVNHRLHLTRRDTAKTETVDSTCGIVLASTGNP